MFRGRNAKACLEMSKALRCSGVFRYAWWCFGMLRGV